MTTIVDFFAFRGSDIGDLESYCARAADLCEREGRKCRTARQQGWHQGRADAYRHLEKTIADLKALYLSKERA